MDSDNKMHPLRVLEWIGKYNPETGYTPHVLGVVPAAKQTELRSSATTSGCGSCGGGKVK